MESDLIATSEAKPSRRTKPQPLDALASPDALLKIETVVAVTGLSIATIYRKATAGEFKPIRLGTRCTRFRAGDVAAWLRKQGAGA